MVSILVRIILSILVGIIVAFAFWFVGFLIITFLAVSTGVVALAGVIQSVGYFAGVIAALWYFFAGYKRFSL